MKSVFPDQIKSIFRIVINSTDIKESIRCTVKIDFMRNRRNDFFRSINGNFLANIMPNNSGATAPLGKN
jgi:hypothetical protein